MKDFETLLSYFPEVEPPVTLTDESIDHISANNDPLPSILVSKFIFDWEGEEGDEFTEFIPCLKFPPKEKIHSLIYWKASLMKYEYILVTTTHKGDLLARKSICGTLVDGDLIKKSVARIDEEGIIHIVAGAHTCEGIYNAQHSQNFNMEIMDNGDIVFLED
jgi:hypothetical protein